MVTKEVEVGGPGEAMLSQRDRASCFSRLLLGGKECIRNSGSNFKGWQK